MKLTQDDVRKLAQLARLNLSDEEVERFAGQLTDILDYVDMLKELDTEGVAETSQVTGLSNVARADEVDGSLCTGEELIDCTPLDQMDGQIRIKRMM